MPFTHANPPMTDNPSSAMNTVSAPNPDTGGNPDMGGDLAVAIALLAQTLATQYVHPPPAPHAPAVPVTSLTRLREPNTFDGSDANKLRVFILQCSLHFQDRANAFSSGRTKVTYALSFLTGPALGWFEPVWPCSAGLGWRLGPIPYGIRSKLRSFRPGRRSRS